MGKSKKRIFNKGKNFVLPVFKREDAVRQVVSGFKSDNFGSAVKNTISLFGITAEELSEAGASFEELMSVKSCIW